GSATGVRGEGVRGGTGSWEFEDAIISRETRKGQIDGGGDSSRLARRDGEREKRRGAEAKEWRRGGERPSSRNSVRTVGASGVWGSWGGNRSTAGKRKAQTLL